MARYHPRIERVLQVPSTPAVQLHGFLPASPPSSGIHLGHQDGPGENLEMDLVFGKMEFGPTPSFSVRATSLGHDTSLYLLMKEFKRLTLRQMVALAQAARSEPGFAEVFLNKYNTGFVQDPSGILRLVSILTWPKFSVVAVGEADKGYYHNENFMLQPA